MSTVVTSSKFSSIEVVDYAKFDNEIVFQDLIMSGESLDILAADDVNITSSGTVAPFGITETAVGPVTVYSSGSTTPANDGIVKISSGRAVNGAVAATAGSIILGYDAVGVATPIIKTNWTNAVAQLGFFNTTPIAQPTTAIVAPAFVQVSTSGPTTVDSTSTFNGYTISEVVFSLVSLGLLA